MPELPEVESARRGIAAVLLGRRIERVVVRERRLRWPVPPALQRALPGHTVHAVDRRAKYLLLRTDAGTAIMHLGMSGSLRFVDREEAPGLHDHVDLEIEGSRTLRLRDPRRFGAMLWTKDDPMHHALLCRLGPEPLEPDFSAAYLHAIARGRKVAVKQLIMDAQVVAGVGNIYASEALFQAGVHPRRAAGRLSARACDAIVAAIGQVLRDAIEQGGTTLRDFAQSDGRPGTYGMHLRVYDREGEPCPRCAVPIRRAVLGQRSTFYCTTCQR